MFKKLLDSLAKPAQGREDFDSSPFDDPVAQRMSWTPLTRGGTIFRTHGLVEVVAGRLEFRATRGAIFCYLILLQIALGVLGILIGVPIFLASPEENVLGAGDLIMALISYLFVLAFAILAVCVFYFGTMPIVFDKGSRFYWKGRTSPDLMINRDARSDWTRLKKIHAVQVIEARTSDGIRSYELNLVIADGKRLNVLEHGNRERLRQDATTLADFLGIPVWDGS